MQLERLMAHLRANAPQVPVILDAKRGDIGSTAEQYAKEAFERYGADAVTLSPFMGLDSVQPYLRYPGKGAFLLCRTSNPGGDDLQNQRLAGLAGEPRLFEHIAELAQGTVAVKPLRDAQAVQFTRALDDAPTWARELRTA